MRVVILALVLGFAATPALAGSDRTTPDEQTAIDQALDRGKLMYAYDQAAWHGTDDFLAKAGKDTVSASGGWIVDGPADAPELVFIDKDSADPHALYIADFKQNKLISSHVLAANEDASLSPVRKRMVAALRIARAALITAKVGRCGDKPFNTIVLSPSSPTAPTPVYFLTPQTDIRTLPFGGHYMIEVMPDGATGPIRSFAKTCMAVPIIAPGGKRPDSLVVSHILDPTPTEIHVFNALTAHIPVYVVTVQNKNLWAVEGDHIRQIDQNKKGPSLATPTAAP